MRLNSSRSDSGIAVKSTVERTWPIFIAAPRIWPSCSTSSRASAAARSPVAASARSGVRTRFAARMPAQRSPWPATRPPTRPVRASREVEGAFASSSVTSGRYGRGGAADHTGAVEILFFETPAEWRAWLAEHHATAAEVEVGFRKRASGLPSLTWSEAVDEALCFGWIDGVRHSVDDTAYRNRFTPRKPGSKWSKVNIAKVAALTKAGKMEPAGVAAFERRVAADYSSERERPAELPPEFEAQLRANPRAWEDFQARPPSYRRAATHWVMSAKREPTRERRLAQLIDCSAQGRTVPPLTRPG